jgi:hypothetical protein
VERLERNRLRMERLHRQTGLEVESFDESSDESSNDEDDIDDMLDELGRLKRVRKLRHLNIAGPLPQSLYRCDFKDLRKRAPNLKSIGLQCQDAPRKWQEFTTRPDSRVTSGAWREMEFVKWMQEFPATTTIALEAMIWGRRRSVWNHGRADKQSRIRIIRPGKRNRAADNSTSGWEDADVVTEVINTDALVVCTPKGTLWQQWWMGKGSQALF